MAVDWLAIRNDYINGGGSYRKLAEKYGVSASRLMQKAAKEKWKDEREANISRTYEKTKQKTQKKISDALSDTAAKEATIDAESRVLAKELTLRLLKNVKETEDTNDLRRLVQCLVDMGVFDSKNGESHDKKNNLLQAIQSTEEINTDDLPEIE